jgi:hypothetical protein
VEYRADSPKAPDAESDTDNWTLIDWRYKSEEKRREARERELALKVRKWFRLNARRRRKNRTRCARKAAEEGRGRNITTKSEFQYSAIGITKAAYHAAINK